LAVDFHEIILPVEYSAMAQPPQGGPEFSHSNYSVPSSGLEDINRNRSSAIHRYTVDYDLLRTEQRKYLNSFFLAIGGIGCGFRMLAPEPHNQSFSGELIATTDGSQTAFPLIKTHTLTAAAEYGGVSRSYVQRIVKPIYGEVELYLDEEPVNLETVGAMNYTNGIYTFDSAPSAGQALKATARYHLPVRFTSDWFSGEFDVSANYRGIGLQELLPKSLGIV
jgi:uncharacterized protein (TIGR02217 family)